jgi:hypothetical protein
VRGDELERALHHAIRRFLRLGVVRVAARQEAVIDVQVVVALSAGVLRLVGGEPRASLVVLLGVALV